MPCRAQRGLPFYATRRFRELKHWGPDAEIRDQAPRLSRRSSLSLLGPAVLKFCGRSPDFFPADHPFFPVKGSSIALLRNRLPLKSRVPERNDHCPINVAPHQPGPRADGPVINKILANMPRVVLTGCSGLWVFSRRHYNLAGYRDAGRQVDVSGSACAMLTSASASAGFGASPNGHELLFQGLPPRALNRFRLNE